MHAHRILAACLGLMLTSVQVAAQVTLTLSVDDPSGAFVPNLRPENFVVYDNGIRQRGVTAEVEHAVVTLSVLVEGGGRYQQLNKLLTTQIPSVARPLVEMLKGDDTIGAFSYSESVRPLFDFAHPNDTIPALFDALPAPVYGEANLYDGLLDVLNRTASMPGRKAVLVISSGLDTFSHTTFDTLRAQAEHEEIPVYTIRLSDTVVSTAGAEGPLARIDWKRFNDQLKMLSRVSGGRSYLRSTSPDVRAIYDDIMEHLRVRYVLRYVPSSAGTPPSGHSIRVDLVNPHTGAPLRIVGDAGRTIVPTVTVQSGETP